MLTDVLNMNSNVKSGLTLSSKGKKVDVIDFDKSQSKGKLASSSSAASSSSSPIGSSSPFTFKDTRFDAYDASSSPFPISQLSKVLATSSSPQRASINTSVIAPSSPCYNNLVASPENHINDNNNNNNNNNNSKRKKVTSNSRTINGTEESVTLRLERGITLQFGRKAKKMSKLGPSRNDASVGILLPASAKNASRLHATVRLSDRKDTLKVEIRVLGQNGMKVNGKLWKMGKVSGIKCVAGRKLELDFWGWSSTILVAESEVVKSQPLDTSSVRDSSPIDSLFDATSSQVDQQDGDLFDSLNPNPISSPALSPRLEATSAQSRSVSPAYSELSELSDSPSSPVLSATIVSEIDDSPAGHLAQSMDLAGLIASAIVFHPRSTVGVEEVIRALLKEVGSMWDVLEGGKGDESGEKEEAAVEAWWDIVERVLRQERFFGCIENVGLKDAAGNQLPEAFYYLPDDDPSKSRVEALEPFVKRVRASRVAGGGKQYYFKRPSMKKNK